jgi:O-antigen/teichoic acid export membrane protein
MASAQAATLKQRVLRAGGWSLAGHGLGQALRLGSNLVMTRLLVPEMFGVMAIALMVTVILALMSDIGLRQNIVRSTRGDDPAFLDTAWAIDIARGVLLWCLALLLSLGLHLAGERGLLPPSSVYASPELPWVIAASSFAAVLIGLQSTKMATAQRSFNQRRLVQIDLTSQLVALAVMVALGVATRSIWALVAGGLVGSLTTTVLSHVWMSGHRNRLRWDPAAFREIIDFGKWAFASSAVFVLASAGDRLLLGGYADAATLGLYAIAALMIRAVEGVLNKLYTSVSLPALSEVARSNPARLREIYYKLSVPVDVMLLFVMGFLFLAGGLVIEALYDPRYAAAGRMLEVLSLSLFAVRYGGALQVYAAVGIPRYLTVINVVRCAALYASVPLMYRLGGTPAAIWAIALHSLVPVPLVYYFNSRLKLNDFRRELVVVPALALGLACGYAANLLRSSVL